MLIDLGQHDDPRTFLVAAMQDNRIDLRIRIDAAKALLRRGDVGKKQEQEAAAKKTATGRYAAAKPPLKLIRP